MNGVMASDVAARSDVRPTKKYRVAQLEEGGEARWDEFVELAPNATFYHLSGWKSLFDRQLRHRTYYLYCEFDGRIVAILPLVRVKSLLFGDALISVPFLVYGGPVATDDRALELVIAEARRLAEDLAVDYLELRNLEPLPGDWLGKESYVTFRKAIEADPQKNLLAIPRKQRAMIRKGIKAGLETEIDTDADRLYRTLLVCKRNLGTPFFGSRWLQAIKDQFGDKAEIISVTHGGEAVCSVMSFRFRNEILPYYGGGGDLARKLSGNDFMYWKVMERACEYGVEIFDYGRSQQGTGSYRFKKHWGFEPRQLYYQYYLVKARSLPTLDPSNKRYRGLIRLWKRLPTSVAQVLGPPIARRLG